MKKSMLVFTTIFILGTAFVFSGLTVHAEGFDWQEYYEKAKHSLRYYLKINGDEFSDDVRFKRNSFWMARKQALTLVKTRVGAFFMLWD